MPTERDHRQESGPYHRPLLQRSRQGTNSTERSFTVSRMKDAKHALMTQDKHQHRMSAIPSHHYKKRCAVTLRPVCQGEDKACKEAYGGDKQPSEPIQNGCLPALPSLPSQLQMRAWQAIVQTPFTPEEAQGLPSVGASGGWNSLRDM